MLNHALPVRLSGIGRQPALLLLPELLPAVLLLLLLLLLLLALLLPVLLLYSRGAVGGCRQRGSVAANIGGTPQYPKRTLVYVG
jgi:hypothetical protein